MKRLSGKVAIVTGAGRGIGRGIAIAYAREGAKVVVASRTKSTVDSVVEEIQAERGTALGIACDVGRRDDVFAMVAKTVSAFATVDILVNNAQGFGTERRRAPTPLPTPLEDLDEEEWEYTFRTGALATLWGMKAVFPCMKDRGGKIINFGSYLGQIGGEGTAAYNAAKEAIRALSRTAAREWGKYKINVNVINPAVMTDAMAGYFDAHPDEAEAVLRQIPLRRWGDPVKDAGGLAVFLASSDADYLTGMTFQLDGGGGMRA
ncbi:MAG: SDR family oxidoreductase [Deltaproteobacteria bacterium]|nr:SDR family oxidoreductase [Deltaproteobacteria bacterium]